MAYDNTNSGILFPNDRKEDDADPDSTGKLNIEGIDYFLSGWKINENGKKCIEIEFKRKGARRNDPSDGDGKLIEVENKQSDRHPDYTGTLKAGGEFEIAAWRKTSNRDGRPFLFITVKKPYRQQQQQQEQPSQPETNDEDQAPF